RDGDPRTDERHVEDDVREEDAIPENVHVPARRRVRAGVPWCRDEPEDDDEDEKRRRVEEQQQRARARVRRARDRPRDEPAEFAATISPAMPSEMPRTLCR